MLASLGNLMNSGKGWGMPGGAPWLPPTTSYTGGTKSRLGQGLGLYGLNRSRPLQAMLLAGHGTMPFFGDSTTLVNVGVGVISVAASPPNLLATYLKANSINANHDAFFGAGGLASGVAVVAADPRLSIPAGSVTPSTAESIGGSPEIPLNSATTLRFTPGIVYTPTFDTVDFYGFNFFTGTRTLTLTDAGGGAIGASISVTPTDSIMYKVTRSVTGTTTILNINRTAGQPAIHGARTYTAANPGIALIGAGRAGWKVSDWISTTTVASPGNEISFFIPSCAGFGSTVVFINIGINDWTNAGTAVATFKSQLVTLVGLITAAGGIPVLCVPIPSDPTFPTQNQADYGDAIYDVSDQVQCPVFDITAKFVSYANANSNGWMGDQLHANAIGYQQIANFIGAGLVLMATTP